MMVKGQGSMVRESEYQNKSPLPLRERVGVRGIIILLLFTVYCSLFTVVTGCGKKAPPKPPQETALVR